MSNEQVQIAPKTRVRYEREIGVFLLTGLPYCVWRAGYKQSKKQYNKYKAQKEEKDRHEKGVPHQIIDPSFELDTVTANHSDESRWNDTVHRNSSCSSLGSASLAEVERELENDEEFQRFMQTQKEAFLSQHRALRKIGGRGSDDVLSTPELPAQPPPDYDAAMARFRQSVELWTSSGCKSSVELDVDGPPRSELPTESRPRQSPVGIVCELPADMPLRPVELPVVRA